MPSDQPPTYGGVLTRPAAQVVAVIAALSFVASLGWKAHDALAAPPDKSSAADLREISDKLEKMNERLSRIEGRLERR